jgi:ABC-type lipoprotein release transport system permease subunit
VFLASIAVLASLGPSRAGARIDPVQALRAEG